MQQFVYSRHHAAKIQSGIERRKIFYDDADRDAFVVPARPDID